MARRSAESAVSGCKPVNGKATGRFTASDRFLHALGEVASVTFVSHVNPDPDSLGSMMGLAHLVESLLHKPTKLTADGRICRAENRAMVELLGLELQPVQELKPRDGHVIVMVDSQPNTGRHNLPPGLKPFAVIDHHDTPGDLTGVSFADIRSNVGATCSVVASYLMEQKVEIPATLATGLMYGIETEVNGYPREASALDDEAMLYLFPLADRDMLARIRNARVPVGNFECLLHALQRSFIYDRLILSWVGELPQPELAAEVADFMIRFEEVDYAVCAGVCEDRLILSMRAAVEDANAGEMLQQVVGDLGRAGGHDRRAGGAIPLTSKAPSAIEQLQSELRRRLLRVLGIEDVRGQRLVPRREMLQNLGA